MDESILFIIAPIIVGIPFLLMAIKPKKVLILTRVFTLFPGKANSIKEAYTMAEQQVEHEDNGCTLGFMVAFGIFGTVFTACFLSSVF